MSLISGGRGFNSPETQALSDKAYSIIRTVLGAIASVSFGFGVIVDVIFSQRYLEPFIGTEVSWVLALGVGSAFEIISSAIIFNATVFDSLTRFEKFLVRGLWLGGYMFDILTNFAEIIRMSTLSHTLDGRGGLEIVLAYAVMLATAVFLAFCEYVFSISFVFMLTNARVWWFDFMRWISEIATGEKQAYQNRR